MEQIFSHTLTSIKNYIYDLCYDGEWQPLKQNLQQPENRAMTIVTQNKGKITKIKNAAWN